MVALTSLNLPAEAWKSARILRAIPNCRLVLMMSYHFLSPALSMEENGLMAYFQTPPDAGPSVTQVTTGLQNWKCAGRRLVEIGGRLPTATQLHQAFVKILSKHLAGNKKVNFVFQQQSSNIPLMNPSPTEIVELFSFVEATLIQYATVAGHFPSATVASVKAKPKNGKHRSARVTRPNVSMQEEMFSKIAFCLVSLAVVYFHNQEVNVAMLSCVTTCETFVFFLCKFLQQCADVCVSESSNVWVDVLEHQPTDSQASYVCLLVLPRLGCCARKNTWRASC